MKNLDAPSKPLNSGNITWSHEDGWKRVGETGLTKREQACISLLIPESGDVELDDLIRKSRRQKLMTSIVAGLMANSGVTRNLALSEIISKQSIKTADELIKQLESE